MGYFDLFIKKQYYSNYQKISNKVRLKEPLFESLNGYDIRSKIKKIKQSINGKNKLLKPRFSFRGIDKQYLMESLNCFKEMSTRILRENPYDEQLCAGMALFKGKIVDMPNGEGKTLAGAIGAFLNHIIKYRVHIITANEYLAQRDTEWMGPLYHSLGMTVAVLQNSQCLSSDINSDEFQLTTCSTSQAYHCDVLYGSAVDFVFNYLRDNLNFDPDQMFNTNLQSVIIDEIDSILIDRARTPVVLSEGTASNMEKFTLANAMISENLKENEDYIINYKNKTVEITQQGILNIERFLDVPNIYDPKLLKDNKLRGFIYTLENAIKAYKLCHENVDYFIEKERVVIIDDLTGRPRYSSKFSNGLHQSIELKHGLLHSKETIIKAKITIQKYFQKYEILSGMSGTALYDETEYRQVYGKDVIRIPSRFKKLRRDEIDVIFRTKAELLNSVVEFIQLINKTGQPILIGTLSVETAEKLANRLDSAGIQYELLHAKNHKREAEILRNAGKIGSVTLAAKMAGRGTDIKIESDIENLGGLFVLGLERHESRRIDEQLKGRTARHGKPGVTQFALSLEDELLLIFGGDKIRGIMDKLGMEDGETIKNKLISKAIYNAQSKVEKHNFSIRKDLYEFDNILDKHRNEIYGLRKTVLFQKETLGCLQIIISNIVIRRLNNYGKRIYKKQFKDFLIGLLRLTGQIIPHPFRDRKHLLKKDICVWAENVLTARIEKKKQEIGIDEFTVLFRIVALQTIDNHWANHLLNLDTLKSKFSMNLYRKMDFIDWYNIESNKLYDKLISFIEEEIFGVLIRIRLNE